MKNRALIYLIVLSSLWVGSSALYAFDDFKVNPYGKFFTDSNGLLSVEMAIKDEKNASGLHDVVLRMRGFYAYEAGIDNQALLYQTRHSSSGVDYTIQQHGQLLVRMTSRKEWGNWDNFQVNIDGKNISVKGDAEKSKTVRPMHLVSAIGQQSPAENLEVNPYGIKFNSDPSGLEVELAVLTQPDKNGLQDILLKISGAAAYEAGIDGKVIRYKAVNGGSGIHYQYEQAGHPLNRATLPDNAGWEQLNLYLGNQTYTLSINKKESSAVFPLHLYSAAQK